MTKDKMLGTAMFLRNLSSRILQIIITAGVILISCVQPLFFRHGFQTIGSDKFDIFQIVSETVIYLVVAFGVVITLTDFYMYYVLKRQEEVEPWWKKDLKLSSTDKFVIFYGAVVYLSFLFSEFPKDVRWGANGWFMGAFTQFLFIAWYFILSRLWKRVTWILYLFLGASFGVFLLAILNRYGIYPIDMKSTNPSYISTIGNINWLCGWWSTIIFLGLILFMKIKKDWFQNSKHPKFAYGLSFGLITIYIVLGLAQGLLNGSASGYVALLVGMMLLFYLAAKEVDLMQRFWKICLILSLIVCGIKIINIAFPEALTMSSTPLNILLFGNVGLLFVLFCLAMMIWIRICKSKNCYPINFVKKTVCFVWVMASVALICYIVLVTINTLHPGAIGPFGKFSAFQFDGGWGSKRGSTWTAGIRTFLDQNWLHKLLGVGPDCMAPYIYSGEDIRLEGYTNYWLNARRLTNAHGEWITVLADLGILGLISYAGFIISSAYRFLKNQKINWFVMGAGICVISYSVNNIFSFQQVNNASILFIIIGIAEGMLRKKDNS